MNLIYWIWILDVVGFSHATFFRVLRLWRETGDVVTDIQRPAGRARILHSDDIDYLIHLIRRRPDWFLDELLDLLSTNRFISVHYATIHRELVRDGMSLKKLRKISKERNEAARADFIARMAQYMPEEIGFIDETSKNETTLSRRRGRARRGIRAETKDGFVRGVRLSAVELMTRRPPIDGIISNPVVRGSVKRADFLGFLRNSVVSTSPLIWLL